MSRTQKTWVRALPKPTKHKVPDRTKGEVSQAAEKLLTVDLRPTYIKEPPVDPQFNYIVDLFSKWYGSYFYLCAKYACPGPYAISPFFETKFARMEYAGGNRFHLSYMRHTGQWFEVYQNLSSDECLEHIRAEPSFQP